MNFLNSEGRSALFIPAENEHFVPQEPQKESKSINVMLLIYLREGMLHNRKNYLGELISSLSLNCAPNAHLWIYLFTVSTP